ncbi:hypothetical protein [Micromonospora sp. AMSO31t]|uniref:hypothetical protein n=1 Tax=Micromonospora sp. AMSO31t TaxID=2650566 RepID=UPI00124B5A81|nr:hypothetical protein [Micromonospora sp. AMSO31t]KAB1913466.1 hypothetical protein F8274_10510 [Micromonospora sp. AMSO31t]
MTDLEDVIRALFRPPGSESVPRAGSVDRLDNGTFHVDYHDSDHVYLVTVRQVPRIRLPLARPVLVGRVAGVRAELVQVSVANHIEVRLDAEPGPPRETALRHYLASYQQWEERAEHGAPPPPWPAEQFKRISLAVSDDVGTPYRLISGQLGGMGTEWALHWGFRPPPPATARRLTLDFTSPDGAPAKIDLPLPHAETKTS